MSHQTTTLAKIPESLRVRLSGWTEKHDALGISAIDHLFNRLDGMYPGKWRSQFGSPAAIENWRIAWVEAFIEEGITFEEVKLAINECRKRFDWPPSLTEFLKCCRPPIDPETAFFEAVNQMRIRYSSSAGESKDRWSSPAIYWAAIEIGQDGRSQPYAKVEKRWKAVLEKAIKESSDKTVPVRVAELSAPTPQADKALAKASLDRIMQILHKRGENRKSL